MGKASENLNIQNLLTIEQVSAVLGCSEKTVKRRIASGDLPVIRDGRMIRVHPVDLERYIKLRRRE